MTRHHPTSADELRSCSRFGRDRDFDQAVILHPRCEAQLADVHDESLGGLGLYLDDVENLPVGQEVDIVFAHEFFRARVCHIEPQGDEYLVGFRCERVPPLEAASLPTA